MLKVVIIGYGTMASSLILGAVESGHSVVGVFRHDRVLLSPAFVWLKDLFNPSKLFSVMKTYKIYDIKAKSVNSEIFKKEILKLNPDVVIVGSWGEIFKKEAIILPPMGTINCHPSMLPVHRGSNPYYSTIKEGETKTGVTFHLMDEKLDSGPILIQKEVDIMPDDTGGALKTRCCRVAKELVKELLYGLQMAKFVPQAQDELKSSYHRVINESDIMINFDETANEIYNRVRAMSPWNKCYISHAGEFLKIKKASIVEKEDLIINNKKYILPQTKRQKGQVLLKGSDWFVVATSDGKKLLFEGLRLFAPASILFTPLFLKSFVKIDEILE